MEPEKNVRLTSAEITQLWTAYMNDTALICQLNYFLAKVEDEEVKPIIQHTVDVTNGHIETLTGIFNKENYPIPYGFKMDEDVDITAPRLFSDAYVLDYLYVMGRISLQAYSISVGLSARNDIYSYFNDCLREMTEIIRETKDVLLSKGLYLRPPYLETPDSIDFVKSQSFLTGYFGERRPLLGTEIVNLFSNFQRNAIGSATMIGYSQVAKSKEVRTFMVKGKEIAKSHFGVFGSIMKEDDLPIPQTWETEVTSSTTYIFSDKLIMFMTTALIGLSVGYYGTSMAMSPRRDLGVQYSKLSLEILRYAEDGANILIKNGWMDGGTT
ncbi:DUF3231 family protein [Shouchella shacheensis]|uniref:DUF3231 family protein n=1 Tax=Shouchella shacheensis TaxID=1649580 RepID=UPI000A95EBC4